MRRKIKLLVLSMLAVCIAVAMAGIVNINAKADNAANYVAVFNATYYAEKYPDLKATFGNNEQALFNHFLAAGMKEGRQGNEEFNVFAYRNRYADLNAAYGDDLKSYYIHYALIGKAEGRNGRATAVATTVTTNANAELPKDAVPVKDGFMLISTAKDLAGKINAARNNNNKSELVWSSSMAGSATERAYELSVGFNSGRPDGQSWQTAYEYAFGPVKEMIYHVKGVATGESLIKSFTEDANRNTYILTDDFRRFGAAVYTVNGESYVVVAFAKR